MANFVAIVDPDPARRQRFVDAAAARVAFLPGLRPGELALGDCAVVWAAGERAPVSISMSAGGSDGQGREPAAAVVWGDAIAGDAGRTNAETLLRLWHPATSPVPAAFDGFHAALRYDAVSGLTVGADVFGFFPIYYAARRDVVLVGSSPELFRLHPLFPAESDGTGLVDMLLAFGPIEGRTLLQGVHRLGVACVLRCNAGWAAEQPNYAIAHANDAARDSEPFGEQVERLHHAWAAAIARHVPAGDDVGMLLSGGRDSRFLSGYLGRRTEGMPALIIGRRGDYEARCAVAVARTLRLQHTVVELRVDGRAADAMHQARWEHLATRFSTLHTWATLDALGAFPPRVLTGYVRECLDYAAPAFEFDALMRSRYNRGFPPAELRRLMHPRWHLLVEERFGAVRDAYMASSPDELERPRRFRLAHYVRMHGGGVPWRLAFASWPVLPILDRGLLDVVASLSMATVGKRRAQDAILRDKFPSLARLPLDRNDFDTEPLLPGPIRHGLNPYLVRSRRRMAQLMSRAGLASERRYYYRIYDIDGPAWRLVRHAAEPFREQMSAVFNMDALRRVLPDPSVTMHLPDTILDGFRPKTMLGLMLWVGAGHSF